MEIRTVKTPGAPAPAGHYSQAVVHSGLVYVAGQLSIDPQTGERRAGTIEEQTEQALSNISEVLKAAGSGLDRILKVTIYISDVSLWGAVNEVYARVMGGHRPARAVVPVGDLRHGLLVEIDAIAAAGD
jgi:2-iminobutanoate/2-iminopropanoate deaminase